ncbi:MAG: TonB-dependent receptor [Calditrichaeota bacterium]|nr:TonB-dependent receptor [Calditrichota bacterium]
MRVLFTVFVFLLFSTSVFAGAIAGKVVDKQTKKPLAGANVYLEGTAKGSSTDDAGMYYFEVDDGSYTVVCSFVGYIETRKQITVSGGTVQLDFALNPKILRTSDIIVEASRAKERETPVAFTDVSADEIARQFTVQDVPHLFKNTPGVYVTSDGGSGLGDSKVYIRGFDEQRISVMINNIEVNDPESKKVYWSNWGALPSGSQSIQIQRGAGSSLYGAGAFGGSINVLTADAPAVSSLKIASTAGMYGVYKLGFEYNTGLFADNKLSFLSRVNYLTGNGWRENTYYQGLSYYFSLSYFANEHHTLRLILHGAPQYHAYSYYSESPEEFAKYGRDWNPHPFVKESDPGLTTKERDGTSLLDLLLMQHVDKDKGGEVIGNGTVSFDNNVYHKPQLELHYTWDINKDTYLQTNSFFTVGRGYGEWVNRYFLIGRDKTGHMSMQTLNAANTYQYRAHSIHEQLGVVSTLNTKWLNHELSFGAEARYWRARHYGLVINTFGYRADTSLAVPNASIKVGGVPAIFREGDIYYDYTGVKPNFSVFGHGLWKFGDLSIMTDLQFSSRMYHIFEDFPSSNNRPVKNGDYTMKQTLEGGNKDGFVNNRDVKYKLVDYKKTYNFVSPKLGVNYNVNDHLNVFTNYSRVYNEPRVKYFFNYGQPNGNLPIETSDDYEFGFGFQDTGFKLKVNAYRILFSNKAYRIQDPEKANQPGYDYRGRRYVTVGKAIYNGIEIASNIVLTRNLDLALSITRMKNAWGDNVSEEARTQLGIEEGKIEPGAPQFMLSTVLNYQKGPFFISAAMRHYEDYYIMPDNDYVDLEYDVKTETVVKRGAVLPQWTVVDLIIGWKQNVGGLDLNASFHVYNLFDKDYWQIGNEYGLLPGSERNAQFSLSIGL